MVYEEKFVMKHNIPPLQAVGWEGIVYIFLVFGGNKSHLHGTYFSLYLICDITKFP